MLQTDQRPARPVIVVQAEADDKGVVWYGVIGSEEIRKVKGTQISQMRPLDEDD
jgi:phosphatidylserine decarboxylase